MTEIIEFQTRSRSKEDDVPADEFLRQEANAVEGKKFTKAVIYCENGERARLTFLNYSNLELLWVAEQIRQWCTR